MSQRTQWIIFAALLCILAVVALTSYLSHKGPAAGPESATTAAAGEAQPAAKPEGEVALDPAQLAPLRDWFNAKDKPTEMSPGIAASFGKVEPVKPAPTPGGDNVTPSTNPNEPEIIVSTPRQIEPPPALQGTLWVNRTAMALFGGEAFRSGERIRGTAYTITEVKAQSVIVKGDDGRVIALKLSE